MLEINTVLQFSYHDEIQKEIAEKSKQSLDSSKSFDNPIVTQIIPRT